MKIQLRPARESDAEFILRVNEENVEMLAPMDQKRLQQFLEWSERFLIAEADGCPAAFLIAYREGCAEYESENYRWFSARHPRFLYIDRIAVAEPFRGMGIGRLLYEEIFRLARRDNVPIVTAEIDIEPVYNDSSMKFHAAMGFHQADTQFTRGGTLRVSLQERDI